MRMDVDYIVWMIMRCQHGVVMACDHDKLDDHTTTRWVRLIDRVSTPWLDQWYWSHFKHSYAVAVVTCIYPYAGLFVSARENLSMYIPVIKSSWFIYVLIIVCVIDYISDMYIVFCSFYRGVLNIIVPL